MSRGHARHAIRAVVGIAILALLPHAAAGQGEAVDWSVPPEVGPPPRYMPPDVEVHTLSNGVTVYLVRRPSLPIVQVNALLLSGSASERPEMAGLAQLTAAVMGRGAGVRSGDELARRVDFIGAELSTRASEHTLEVLIKSPARALDPALDILADVVLRPSLDEASFENLRSRFALAHAGRGGNSTEVANGLYRRALFDSHAYGRFGAGTAATVRSIALDDVRRFHREAARPGRAVIVVVGAVGANDVVPALERRFGGPWSRGPAGDTLPQPLPREALPGLFLVDRPGASQSIIRIAQRAPQRESDDYHAFQVLNMVLGGSTTSRLGTRLRETRGVTYDARSDFVAFPDAGMLVLWSNIETGATTAAVTAMLEELRAIRERVSPAELELAKSHLMLSFPEPFATISGVAAMIGGLVAAGLPPQAHRDYAQRIQDVSAADVRRVARRYIDLDALSIVIVGDLDAFEQELVRTGVGEPRVIAADEALSSPGFPDAL